MQECLRTLFNGILIRIHNWTTGKNNILGTQKGRVNMRICGYERITENNIEDTDNEKRLLCLEEATIVCSLKEIDTLIEFFTDMKKSLEKIDDYIPSYSHLSFFNEKMNLNEESDLIIAVVNED